MLTSYILSNGGATIDKNGKITTLKSGYQVSKKDCLKLPISQFNETTITSVLGQGLKRGEYAGFWLEDGYIYGDISMRIATKHKAIKMGCELNQIAIWDWRKSQSVYCKA